MDAPMRALTIWEPWASLIMVGAKPYEFRRYPFPRWLIGKRIVIHAGARPVKLAEVEELLANLGTDADGTALKPEIARLLLQRTRAGLIADAKGAGSGLFADESSSMCLERPSDTTSLPLACGIGTVVLGTPRKATALFGPETAGSTRIDQHVWAWPCTHVEAFDAPIPARGAQGFWEWKG